MNDLPAEVHERIMRAFFTHHVLPELARHDYKPRVTNTTAAIFVDVLEHRIELAREAPVGCAHLLRSLCYARDVQSNRVFSVPSSRDRARWDEVPVVTVPYGPTGGGTS